MGSLKYGVFTFYLSDLERSMSRSLRFGRPISHKFLICLQKIAKCHTNCRCQAERQGPWTSCLIFEKTNKQLGDILPIISFLLTWDPGFKSLPLLQITEEIFNFFLNFLPNGPHKTTFGIFEILKIEILINFIRFR